MSWLNRAKPTNSQVDSENPYWISFSDIMAGLLAVFILALVSLMIRLDNEASLTKDIREKVEAAIRDLAEIEKIRKDILEYIQKELETQGIRVDVSENSLRIPEEELYFKSASHTIPHEKTQAVSVIGEVLKKALYGRTKFIDTIFKDMMNV